MARDRLERERRRHGVHLRPAHRRHLLGRHRVHRRQREDGLRQRRGDPRAAARGLRRRLPRRLLGHGGRRRRHREGRLRDSQRRVPAGHLDHEPRDPRRLLVREDARGALPRSRGRLRALHPHRLHAGHRHHPRQARRLRLGLVAPREHRRGVPRRDRRQLRRRGQRARRPAHERRDRHRLAAEPDLGERPGGDHRQRRHRREPIAAGPREQLLPQRRGGEDPLGREGAAGRAEGDRPRDLRVDDLRRRLSGRHERLQHDHAVLSGRVVDAGLRRRRRGRAPRRGRLGAGRRRLPLPGRAEAHPLGADRDAVRSGGPADPGPAQAGRHRSRAERDHERAARRRAEQRRLRPDLDLLHPRRPGSDPVDHRLPLRRIEGAGGEQLHHRAGDRGPGAARPRCADRRHRGPGRRLRRAPGLPARERLVFPFAERVQLAGVSSAVHGFRFTSEAFGDFAGTWIQP
ncbi:hypothetical protein ACH61_02122 [Rathayibacter tanaceti]|uniref:Uncharacterized protein n=1 Tax=Rathayibacter tanaceti TaxID=1671680 RepID=A0A166HKG9_9MICO|nr:hypothetical protein ACH61_02122 [Rathayibacter tanaceti]